MNTARPSSFQVHVAKENFKFNAAHFVAFDGFRERLHGHNYKASVRLYGERKISSDGYVVDFGDIKKVTRQVCKDLNEHFLCPMYSDVIEFFSGDASSPLKDTVTLQCQDGSTFVFPKGDCAMLPLVHSTAEELAIYLWSKILGGLDANFLLGRGIHTLEVIVAEATGQEAVFTWEIAKEAADQVLDVRKFIMETNPTPKPCLATNPEDVPKALSSGSCCPLRKNTLA